MLSVLSEPSPSALDPEGRDIWRYRGAFPFYLFHVDQVVQLQQRARYSRLYWSWEGFLRFRMCNRKTKQKKWCTTFLLKRQAHPMTSGTYRGPHLYFTGVKKFSQMSFIILIRMQSQRATSSLFILTSYICLSWKRALMLKFTLSNSWWILQIGLM